MTAPETEGLLTNIRTMSGSGNRLIVATLKRAELPDTNTVRALVSSSPIPIDGVVFGTWVSHAVQDDSPGHLLMHYYNADGSLAELCVNGVRCLAWYCIQYGLCPDEIRGGKLPIRTPAGKRLLATINDNVVAVRVAEPVYMDQGGEPQCVHGLHGVRVSVGNPHFLVPVDDLEAFDVPGAESVARDTAAFPHGTNIEFYSAGSTSAKVGARGEMGPSGFWAFPIFSRSLSWGAWVLPRCIQARVYERGVGETEACGSGALALYFHLLRQGIATAECYQVQYPGGLLQLYRDGGGDEMAPHGHLWLKGPVHLLR